MSALLGFMTSSDRDPARIRFPGGYARSSTDAATWRYDSYRIPPATRNAFAITVSMGLKPPLVTCNEASAM